MLKSMTGYGRAASTGGNYSVEAEIRSVNGRFLKTHCKLPPHLTRFESSVEKVLKQSFSRGTVDIYLKSGRMSNPGGYIFNADVARGYWRQLQKMKEEFTLDGKVSFELLSTLPGVLVAEEESEVEAEELTPLIEAAVRGAAENAAQMRQAEGAELANDLANHMNTVEELLDDIKARTPEALEDYKARFTQRVTKLLDGIDIDPQDQALAREIVFYIERSDMSEEIARMGSHVLQFRSIMNAGGAVGRQLEFLGQEMHREANTMGAKSNDAELSARVTALKTTVDKIREQVLNIE
jgi:uncharacterized protein (TIGR00255 family)